MGLVRLFYEYGIFWNNIKMREIMDLWVENGDLECAGDMIGSWVRSCKGDNLYWQFIKDAGFIEETLLYFTET